MHGLTVNSLDEQLISMGKGFNYVLYFSGRGAHR
jgi:hypothetical protein